MFWHVFYCQHKCPVCWYKLTGFLSTNSDVTHRITLFSAMWLPFQRQSLMMTYKQQVCCAVWSFDILCEPNGALHIHHKYLSMANKIRHVHASLQANGGPFLTLCNWCKYVKSILLCTLWINSESTVGALWLAADWESRWSSLHTDL